MDDLDKWGRQVELMASEDEASEVATVTGTQNGANPGWQERAERLCRPKNWTVQILPNQTLYEGLTTAEWEQVQRYIALVAEGARYMMAGMVKGTIKYPVGTEPMEYWLDHLIGEGADQMNYQLLLADAARRQAKPHASRDPV